MKYKDIAEKYKVSLNTVKSWKQRYGWIKGTKSDNSRNAKKGVHTKQQKVCTQKNGMQTSVLETEFDLSEKEQFFCIYFMKNHNATRAYMKAYQCGYESAAVSAHKLLKKAKIKNYIVELRNRKMKEIDLREEDLTERLVDIAFSDINDFADVTNGEVVMKDEFDGSLVRSIKNGKYGITFQLEDRVKAIQELRKNFKNDMEEQEERAVIEISEVMEDDSVDTTAETESISET